MLDSKTLQKIWLRVVKTDSCWHWIGSTLNGYPTTYIVKKSGPVYAHRALFEHYRGQLGGRHLKNTCGTRLCVNPDHWEHRAKPHKTKDISMHETSFRPLDHIGEIVPAERYAAISSAQAQLVKTFEQEVNNSSTSIERLLEMKSKVMDAIHTRLHRLDQAIEHSTKEKERIQQLMMSQVAV